MRRAAQRVDGRVVAQRVRAERGPMTGSGVTRLLGVDERRITRSPQSALQAATIVVSNNTCRLQLLDLFGPIAQRSQHLVIVFAEVRRRRPYLAIKTCDLAGLRHQVDFAEAGMGDGALDAERLDLWVGKRVLDAEIGRAHV